MPGDPKIRCPKDRTVMHKFRIPHRAGDAPPDYRRVQPGTGEPGPGTGEMGPAEGAHPAGDPEHAATMVIDRCPVCRAFWVDRGELEHVLEHGIARMAELRTLAATDPTPDGAQRTLLACPRDGACLVEITDLRQDHIRYDLCPVCGGILFDAGELTDLSEHTLAERVRGVVRRLRG